jgi:hypothetical protein
MARFGWHRRQPRFQPGADLPGLRQVESVEEYASNGYGGIDFDYNRWGNRKKRCGSGGAPTMNPTVGTNNRATARRDPGEDGHPCLSPRIPKDPRGRESKESANDEVRSANESGRNDVEGRGPSELPGTYRSRAFSSTTSTRRSPSKSVNSARGTSPARSCNT